MNSEYSPLTTIREIGQKLKIITPEKIDSLELEFYYQNALHILKQANGISADVLNAQNLLKTEYASNVTHCVNATSIADMKKFFEISVETFLRATSVEDLQLDPIPEEWSTLPVSRYY